MAIQSRKAIWPWITLAGLSLTGILSGLYLWPRLHFREQAIFQALYYDRGPAVWWPPDWRREFRSSYLLEGYAYLKDKEATHPFGRLATAGTIELAYEARDQVLRTTVSPKGLYSFNPQLISLGSAKIRLVSTEGSTTRWVPVPVGDAGFHRINFTFSDSTPSLIPGP
jgi:hypothetical protein